MAPKTNKKPKQTPSSGQKSIASFLNKVKKPAINGRNQFFAEKLAANLNKITHTNIINEGKSDRSDDTFAQINVAE